MADAHETLVLRTFTGPEFDQCPAFEDMTRAGSPHVRCNHCEKEFWGGRARIRVHLTGVGTGVTQCPSAPPEVVTAMLVLNQKGAAAKKATAAKKAVASAISINSNGKRDSAMTQTSIQQGLKKGGKEHVDLLFAQFVYANGLAFQVSESPYFKLFVDAATRYGPGYKPPGAPNHPVSAMHVFSARSTASLGHVCREPLWALAECKLLCYGL